MTEALERAVLAGVRAWLRLSHPLLVREFARRLGYVPDLAVPRTYNEKVLWRKLIDHDPRFAVFADKLAAKEYARERCPDLAIPRTLWVGESADAIPDAALSGDVVVKTNHGFNFNVFIAKGTYDRPLLVRTVARWLRTVHGRPDGEWAYGRIRPRVFVEERLLVGIGDAPTDIKVHACDGEIVHGWAVNKVSERAVTLSASGDPIAPALTHASNERSLAADDRLRTRFAEARRFAAALSRGVDYARYDFLVAPGQLYFGEITLYPAAGYDSWSDPAIALRLSRCWDLQKSAFLAAERGGPAGVYARALRARLGRLARVARAD
jgi:TupA-like ATPgrasp